MIIWLFAFLVIVVISFILAYQSMKDYEEEEQPSHSNNLSIFLIRNVQGLTVELLNRLHEEALKHHLQISLERIFKGPKQAFIISGPKSLIEKFTDLNLLELEDYAENITGDVLSWELGVKDGLKLHFNTEELAKTYFQNLPHLSQEEQFFFQVILNPKGGTLWPKVKLQNQESLPVSLLKTVGVLSSIDSNIKKKVKEDSKAQEIYKQKKAQKVFSSQIRIVFSGEENRLKELTEAYSGTPESLIKIPRPLTSSQIFNFYKKRRFVPPIQNNLALTSEELKSFFEGSEA